MKNIYSYNIQPLRGCADGWIVIDCILYSVIQIESLRDCCGSKINEIVYELYELTDAEIKIVERK